MWGCPLVVFQFGNSAALFVDVGVKLCWIRFGVVGREFSGFVYNGAHLGIDLLQGVLVREALLEHAAAHLLDRIVPSAHFIDLLFAAVFRWIRHGMPAVAIGEHFKNDRPVAG